MIRLKEGDTYVSFAIAKDMVAKVEAIAKAQDRPRSYILRKAVEEYVARHPVADQEITAKKA
jgi:predicted transcriptional regulator